MRSPKADLIFDWPVQSHECFLEFSCVNGLAKDCIVLCKSVVSEGKELISNWPIRFQETHGFSFFDWLIRY